MKIIVVSGGFDPLHSGHIEYFKAAKNLGDKLIVALNSDKWLERKKSKYFMSFQERRTILENLVMIDEVIDFEDDVIGSCINGLKKIKGNYPKDEIIFCNGGDRDKNNCPEMELDGLKFIFGVGGKDKKNSSSAILKRWNHQSEKRIWGEFYNLFSDLNSELNIKIKELIISPKKGMSFQKHFFRNEIWFVSRGNCYVRHSMQDSNKYDEILLKAEDFFQVKKQEWHQLINPSTEPCHIIEIQYGELTDENDIERLRFYEGNDL